MALEPAAEVDPDALCWRRDSWRCLIWGDYLDAVIARHRAVADALGRSSTLR